MKVRRNKPNKTLHTIKCDEFELLVLMEAAQMFRSSLEEGVLGVNAGDDEDKVFLHQMCMTLSTLIRDTQYLMRDREATEF